MHHTYVIKKPLITEKSTEAMADSNRYAFEVDPRATKDQIKDAVQKLYNVHVVDVTTQIRKGKRRRLRYGWISESKSKTASVRLREGETIELF